MNTAEQNYRLLQEIEASRMFLLMACQQNPKLLERADARIKQILEKTELDDHSISQSLPRGECKSLSLNKQGGISLIELLIFMIIISIAVTGVLLVMNRVTGQSSDALIRKQALAIAESVLEEVGSMPFTFCDPDDPNAATAANAAGCTAGLSQDVITGPTPALVESRYNAATPLDNVADYSNCRLNRAGGSTGCDAGIVAPLPAIIDITGANNTALGGYDATVTIARAGVALGLPTDPDALQIIVTVNGPGGTQVRLDGYRVRYSPNSF
jgi:MSHA pilin protein MshD